MELVHPLEPTGEESPLARARLHRQLTVEETARRAGITAEEVRWLEEGRVYRFPRPDDALDRDRRCTSTALGIENREARELAGLPVPPQPVERESAPTAASSSARSRDRARRVRDAALHPALGRQTGAQTAERDPAAAVAHPVNVLNGSGDINYTRQVASRIGAFGYTIKKVGRADELHVSADRGVLPAEVRRRRASASRSSSAWRRSRSPAGPGL